MLSPVGTRDRNVPGGLGGRLFGVFPVVLIAGALLAVYALPESTRRSLRFDYADPTLVTAYAAHFVHFSPSHLRSNLAAFLVVGTAVAYLTARARDGWLFVGLLTVLLVAAPPALSFLNLAVPRPGITYGFSGLNMAFVGFLPIAIVRYLETRHGRAIDTTLPLAAFFGSTGYVAIAAVPGSRLSVAVAAAALVLGTAFAGCFAVLALREFGTTPAALRDPAVIVGVGVWIALLSSGFPDVVAGDGAVVNVYIHFLGYALGFTTAYAAHEWGLTDDRRRTDRMEDAEENAAPTAD